MQVRRVEVSDLYAAMDAVNTYYAGNVRFNGDPTWINGTTVQFRLAVGDSRQPGAKITGIPYRERRSRYACWHAHRDFMAALYAIRPDALLMTSFERYESAADFVDKVPATGVRNVGSQVHPVQAREECDCDDVVTPLIDALNKLI